MQLHDGILEYMLCGVMVRHQGTSIGRTHAPPASHGPVITVPGRDHYVLPLRLPRSSVANPISLPPPLGAAMCCRRKDPPEGTLTYDAPSATNCCGKFFKKTEFPLPLPPTLGSMSAEVSRHRRSPRRFLDRLGIRLPPGPRFKRLLTSLFRLSEPADSGARHRPGQR